jgi:hypothetical protein
MLTLCRYARLRHSIPSDFIIQIWGGFRWESCDLGLGIGNQILGSHGTSSCKGFLERRRGGPMCPPAFLSRKKGDRVVADAAREGKLEGHSGT